MSKSYISNSSPTAGAPPRESLPTISKPTIGIGPVGSTTSIPSLLLAVDSFTSVISPNGIVAHLLFLVKNLSAAVEVPYWNVGYQ